MSLTTQLHDGELATWCAARLPGTGAVATAVARAGSGHQPIRPAGAVGQHHWAAIGGALGVRLAFLVQQAPPYYSLLGLAGGGIVSRRWADTTAASWPTHRGLPAAQRARALQLRPTPTGWLDLGPALDPGGDDPRQELLLADFFGRTQRDLEEHAPAGQVASPAVEARLSQSCYVISRWEDIYRSGTLVDTLLALHEAGSYHPEELLAVAPQAAVAELGRLIALTRTSGVLKQWRDAAGRPAPGQPLGVAAPVIVDNWADADLLIGRPGGTGGHTLVDVKTVLRLDDPQRTARWLWQILGYAWLDVAGRWDVESVALYFARHGLQLTWPLAELAEELAGPGVRVDALRAEFRQLAEKVLVAEGAHLPGD
ncbi:MAG TPA: hypothetical protein VHX38_11745 [Pseudonocardiaceae bacterium]|jgi:hypothetical protein|nr:hypothetical protein [Pseudonocardiaceae bacterium]